MRAMLDALEEAVAAEAEGVDVTTGEVLDQDAIEVPAENVTYEPPDDKTEDGEEVNEEPPAPPVPATKAQIDEAGKQMKRVGWGGTEGRAYLGQHFNKAARSELTDAEITQFIEHLKGLPAPGEKEEGDA